MKPFRSVLNEAAGKARVVLFGRMNPPTSGHEENVLAAHKVAQQHHADLHVVASHSHDAKKNPLNSAQKNTHLQRAFGHLKHTTVSSSSKEAPSVLHQAVAAHKAGVEHLILAGGGDRAAGMHKLLTQYNGKTSAHGHYNFKKISVANTGERKEGVSGTDMRKHAAAGNFNEFKKHLPSKIAAHDKHAQELYNHVRSGMGVHKESYNRDHYVAGIGFKLGDIVEDTFTGLEGRIVYRGPTYVTMQIDSDISFKRWVEDVDPMTHVPADIKAHHLNRIKFCPGAVTEFSQLMDDSSKDQSIVLEALDKTAHYLDIEEHADPAVPATLNDHAVAEFVSNMRAASQLLNALGVLPKHESYMEMHAHRMMNIVHGNAPEPQEESMENFKNFYVQEAKADIEDPNSQHLSDKDLTDIEKHIDKLEWEDIRHLYADQEHQEMEEELALAEALTAAQRMKKKFEFMKTKAKREVAAKLARKRLSTQGKLKKKAIVHARSLIMQKLLKGRDKGSLSAAEKDRIEAIVHRAKGAVVRISNKLMPKLRDLEMQRIRHQVREDWSESGDVEEKSNASIALNDTPADIHPGVTSARNILSGLDPEPQDPRNQVDKPKGIRKLKNFRKMEV
jgi:hypothetical protein